MWCSKPGDMVIRSDFHSGHKNATEHLIGVASFAPSQLDRDPASRWFDRSTTQEQLIVNCRLFPPQSNVSWKLWWRCFFCGWNLSMPNWISANLASTKNVWQRYVFSVGEISLLIWLSKQNRSVPCLNYSMFSVHNDLGLPPSFPSPLLPWHATHQESQAPPNDLEILRAPGANLELDTFVALWSLMAVLHMYGARF